jgi:hypothetical protein
VTVRLRDEGGEPVDTRIRVSAPAETQQLGPGETRFDDLPAGKVAFWCHLGGVEFRIEHDTAEPEAKLTVPRLARLTFAAANAWPPTGDHAWLVAIVRRLDAEQDELRVSSPNRSTAEPTLMLPGRYRIDLVERRGYGDDGVDVPLGLTAEITLHAGEDKTATLR